MDVQITMPKIYTIVFWFSIILVCVSVFALFAYGLRFGVDFKGGSVLEIEYQNVRPDQNALDAALKGIPSLAISPAGDKGFLIKAGELSEDQHQEMLAKIRGASSGSVFEEKRFDSVGPTIGSELKRKSIIAIGLVLLGVIIYIAIVFRKMSRTLSPWAMGLAAIVALLHDVLIPMGVFAVLGRWLGVEISAVFVAAALTILGYSMSDTVVIFDRVRENIVRKGLRGDFGAVVHTSVMETLARSLNTTFTTLLSLFAIYFFGGESIKYFALALIIGIFLGAYSSIFVAAPVLVWWQKRFKR